MSQTRRHWREYTHPDVNGRLADQLAGALIAQVRAPSPDNLAAVEKAVASAQRSDATRQRIRAERAGEATR
jgi:hypothetical protein